MYEPKYSISVRVSKELHHSHVGSEQVVGLITQLLQVRAFKNHMLFISDNTASAFAFIANTLHARDLCKVYNTCANLPRPACPTCPDR
jgi:hypothetical protein